MPVPQSTILAALPPAARMAQLMSGNYGKLARKAGLVTSYVSRILRNKRSFSFRIGCLIADAAGVSLDELRAFLQNQGTLVVGAETRGDRGLPAYRRRMTMEKPIPVRSMLSPEEQAVIAKANARVARARAKAS